MKKNVAMGNFYYLVSKIWKNILSEEKKKRLVCVNS